MNAPTTLATRDLIVSNDATGIERLTAAGAIAANLSLPIIEFWRMAASGEAGSIVYAAFGTAATIVLQLRHVLFGLRNERPPAAGWTLGALALINALGVVLVGRGWALQFASLAVSVLILLPGPTAIVLASAITLAPIVLLQSSLPLWQPVTNVLLGPWPYLVSAIIWRTTTLYVPVRLLITIRKLQAARRDLEARAILQTRSRIEGELREGLGHTFERIIAEGERAQAVVQQSPEDTSREIQSLASDARRVLADARRIVAGYRSTTLGAELDAATALLEASGARVRMVITPGVSLDVGAERARGAVRAAVIKALEEGPRGYYAVQVWLDDRGEVQVRLDAERRTAAEVS